MLFSFSPSPLLWIFIHPCSLGFGPHFRTVTGDRSVLSSRFHLIFCGVMVRIQYSEEVRQNSCWNLGVLLEEAKNEGPFL